MAVGWYGKHHLGRHVTVEASPEYREKGILVVTGESVRKEGQEEGMEWMQHVTKICTMCR